jgi:anti-sigma regulatory factor (Ser/Thr protein kinase)
MKKSSKLSRDFLLKLELRSHPTLLCVVRGALEPLMETLGFSDEHNRAIIRAVDEAVSNIMRHAYHGRLDQPIEIYCNRLQRRAEWENGAGRRNSALRLRTGRGPTKIPARPLDEIRPGGLGLHIIRGSMDTVEYKRAGRLNRLRLVKFARPSKGGCGVRRRRSHRENFSRHVEKATILDVTGNIDMSNSPEVRKALLREIREKA